MGSVTYVQAKLNAIADEDINSNGSGVAESTVCLYNVSEPLKDASKKDPSKKTNVVREPRERKYVKFFLN